MRRIGHDRHQLGAGIWRAETSDEVRAELDFHIEMLTREYVQSGLSPDAARAEALRRFGDPRRMAANSLTSARARDDMMRRKDYFTDLTSDLRYAMRQVMRAKGFTAVVVLTLAIGIGATTAIFSTVNAVVLRPFAVAHPDRVMYISSRWPGQDGFGNVSIGNFVDMQAEQRAFTAMAAIAYQGMNLADDGEPERVLGARVTASLFPVLGVPAALGRTFTAQEDAPGNDDVVVLTDALWTRRFAHDPRVLGREIRINARPYRVIGVMPPSFDPTLSEEQLWIPIAFTPPQRAQHDEHFLDVLGLLKPGASQAQARAELSAVMNANVEKYPTQTAARAAGVTPVAEIVLGDVPQRLFVLLAAVSLVLLIACGNVANLLLARGASRSRELAVRAAIGAGRGRIVRQLVTEAGVLALMASAFGVVIAIGLVRVLVTFAPAGTPRIANVQVDGTSIAFAIGLGVVCSVIAGLAPALGSASASPQLTLREGGRGTGAGHVRDRLRSALVVSEVALALTLLIGAGLLIRSAFALQRADPGFDPRGAMMARVSLPRIGYESPAKVVQTLTSMVDILVRTPGIDGAGVTSQAPLGPGGGSNGLVPEGKERRIENSIDARLRMITPGYLAAIGIPLRVGRAFDTHDVAGAERVMIVSEGLAKRLFPNQGPLGKLVYCCEGSDTDPRPKRVVGVVGDVRSGGLGAPIQPEFYLPIAQAPDIAWDWISRSMAIVTRGHGESTGPLIAAMRSAVHAVDPAVPLDRIATMGELLRRSTAAARFNTILLTLLGIIGGMLAAIGIYGVVSYFVALRTHEIGVRMALGAQGIDVLRLLTWQGVRPVLVGVAIGIAASLASSRVLASALFGISSTDAMTFALVVPLFVIVGLAATLIPARRALRVEPVRALQE